MKLSKAALENFRSAKFIQLKDIRQRLFFCLIEPPPRKVTTLVQTLARQVGIFPQPYAFHTVFSHNQTSEMSALLAKNMRQIDQQDGRSMAAQYHHLAYSVL